MSTIYFYGDAAQSAAKILLDTPALRHDTTVELAHWAGAQALKVTHDRPLSDGQLALWALLEGISSDQLVLWDIAARVDAASLVAVHEALAAWWRLGERTAA